MQPSPREDLLPSTPVCLRDSAPRSCSPSPPIHLQRIRWRVNACSRNSDDLSVLARQQLWGKFFNLFRWYVQRSGDVGFSIAFRRECLDNRSLLPAFPEISSGRELCPRTVARQRGISTRFPVFAQRRRRAFLSLERAGQRTDSNEREEGSQIGQAAVGVTGILRRYVTWVEDSSRSNDVVYISPALCYALAT
jgi:hypothetical protein